MCGVILVSTCHRINQGVLQLMKKVTCHCSTASVCGSFLTAILYLREPFVGSGSHPIVSAGMESHLSSAACRRSGTTSSDPRGKTIASRRRRCIEFLDNFSNSAWFWALTDHIYASFLRSMREPTWVPAFAARVPGSWAEGRSRGTAP